MTLSGGDHGTTATREDSGVATKSFEIPKRLIWEAWKRVAVKLLVEPEIDAIFHSSSFGCRPNKSAKHAVAQARKNCWRYDWVVDIDLKSFFDTIDHELLGRAVEKHVREPWARLYIRRWLESPVQKQTGELAAQDRGTPQGGVISPLLANLFLHYAFDRWVQTKHPEVPFERYADDVVCHCRTKQQAEKFLSALRERLTACGLMLHPEKTRLVYCKDGRRREEHTYTKFDFLGFSFHARTVQDREGNLYTGFGPAVIQKALTRMP